MVTSLDYSPSTMIRQWEEAGASLANALANYLQLSTFLETCCSRANNKNEDLVARIDSSLQTLHITLDQQLEQSRLALARARNKLTSPIYYLPEEILAEIFTNVLYATGNEVLYDPPDMCSHVQTVYRRLYNLLGVCTVWRNLALNRPAFWSLVPLVDSPHGPWRPLLPELSVQRSGRQALHLAVHSSNFPWAMRIERLDFIAKNITRLHTLNIHSELEQDISHMLHWVLGTGVPKSLSEVSLCFHHPDDEIQPEASIYRCLNHQSSRFTKLINSLSVLRISNIRFQWSSDVFSNTLRELRVDRIRLSGDSIIKSFITALESAQELQDLTIIRIEAFADAGPIIPARRHIVLPKLRSLYLEDLYFNFLNFLLTTITPLSYKLTFNPSERTIINLLPGPGEEYIDVKDLYHLIARFPTNQLVLSDTVPLWEDRKHLHDLLRSMPTLKKIVFNLYNLDNDLLKALEPPSSKNNNPFPKLEAIQFRGIYIADDLSGLKTVVTKHQIQSLVLGLSGVRSDERVQLSEEDEIVRWLTEAVPFFRFICEDFDAPDCMNSVWKLWNL